MAGSLSTSPATAPFGDGGPATAARLYDPSALAVDSAGNLYIADRGNNRVRKVSQQGIITTFAGPGNSVVQCGGGGVYSGDGGPATSASLNCPSGLAIDRAGNVYIADAGNFVIRKVTSDGTISTFAGIGTQGYSGDGGPAAKAQLTPCSLAINAAGDLYVSDSFASVIRKISADGAISTFAGNGTKGYAGDGGPATKALITNPGGLALDGMGNVFIADSGNNLVRKVAVNGVITTVAGNGNLPYQYSGDGGPATSASFQNPASVAVDSSGNLFIADVNSNRIREVLTSGIIVTAAGNGNYIYQGDGGPATNAGIQSPFGVLADGVNIYIADSGHNLVRLLKPGAPPSGPPPVISKGGIVPIFSTSQTFQSASWISIYGSNLISGSTPVVWKGDYPRALGGTSVVVNNIPVPLSYVSSTLINAYVPWSGAGGTVNVTVTDANGTGTATATLALASPAFSLLGDGIHVAGIIVRSDSSGAFGGGTYDVIGPAGNSLGYPTVPAKAGDNIVLFGVGFGPTDPPGVVRLSGTTVAVFKVEIMIGDTPVRPTFAGLSLPGLFQLNLTLPPGLGSGDRPVAATVIGLSTQKNVAIALR